MHLKRKLLLSLLFDRTVFALKVEGSGVIWRDHVRHYRLVHGTFFRCVPQLALAYSWDAANTEDTNLIFNIHLVV